MLEFQLLGSCNSIRLSPALGGPVTARGEESVQHGEVNDALHPELITPLTEYFADDLLQAELNPKAAENQVRANLGDGHRFGLSRRMGIETRKRLEKRKPDRKSRSSCPLACRTSSAEEHGCCLAARDNTSLLSHQ
jgi:hypothetical protein